MSQSTVNPQLRKVLRKMPSFEGINDKDLPEIREIFSQSVRLIEGRNLPDVEALEEFIPSPGGAPNVRTIIYQKKDAPAKSPAIVYFHGGGMIAGHPGVDDPKCQQLVSDMGFKIFSVDYRLAPEVPYPGPLEDCYTVLSYVFDNADKLGVDKGKIAVGGESAGGGLSASICLLARDRKKYNIAFQLLIYPWLNDKTAITTDPGPAFGEYVWTRDANKFAWKCYIGDKAGGDETPGYAAALRAKDVSNLPPAFIGVGSMDLFLKDDLAYAERLMTAGTRVEVNVVPGAYHVFDMYNLDAEVTRNFYKSYCTAMAREMDL